jgi:hypothetical protein
VAEKSLLFPRPAANGGVAGVSPEQVFPFASRYFEPISLNRAVSARPMGWLKVL